MWTVENQGRGGSVVASVLGIDRFRMWTGRSGRRHLFSRLDGSLTLDDLAGAVVLIAPRGDGEAIVWVGAVEAATRLPLAPGLEVFAHWLAETPAARAAIAADLDGRVEGEPASPSSTGRAIALAA